MDNKLHYAHTFFCGHLAAVGRASEVQAADQRWQTEKPLTREAYERLSSIYYESFIDSLMQVDGQTSGAVYADTAHLTLETDRLLLVPIAMFGALIPYGGSTIATSKYLSGKSFMPAIQSML